MYDVKERVPYERYFWRLGCRAGYEDGYDPQPYYTHMNSV